MKKSWDWHGSIKFALRKRPTRLKRLLLDHIISRCVRRAFLCGEDSTTGFSYEHRRKWIVQRMQYLAKLFSIDVCAYAVMSNHSHLVLKVNSTTDWTDQRVLMTWAGLFELPLLCERFVRGEHMSKPELDYVIRQADVYRKRLMSISWFMKKSSGTIFHASPEGVSIRDDTNKCLNEYISKRANVEDKCTGHFWQSRFKSQALLDERALLTCMAYVDLNPIRAAMAQSPEASDYTSIQERIKVKNSKLLAFIRLVPETHPFGACVKILSRRIFGKGDDDLPYSLSAYLDLVDLTGRVIVANKRGFIPPELTPIMQRLNLNPDTWLDELNSFKSIGITAVGTVDQLKGFCKQVGKRFSVGLKIIPALE